MTWHPQQQTEPKENLSKRFPPLSLGSCKNVFVFFLSHLFICKAVFVFVFVFPTCLQGCAQWSNPHEVRRLLRETSQAQSWLPQSPENGDWKTMISWTNSRPWGGGKLMNYTIIIIILGFMVMILIIRKIIMMMMKIMNIKYQLTKQPQGRRIEVGGWHQRIQDPTGHCHLIFIKSNPYQIKPNPTPLAYGRVLYSSTLLLIYISWSSK